ncbi:MAG: V-type ATP synthase subunit D [Nitrospiraceae bacterium]|nr:MAG: V-type ATP synthase subunit D [Nitrospiraceae bacterium]
MKKRDENLLVREMIHPTRTNLLILGEKALSVSKSIGILKARRQALIRELLHTTVPFLDSREEIRRIYGKALDELSVSLGYEKRETIDSIAVTSEQELMVEIIEKSIWGLKYRDIETDDSPVRNPQERGYDYSLTNLHLEECIYLFEKLVESMIGIAAFESKIKIISEEITKSTRRIRILEERRLPELKRQIKTISLYISEREREAHYRLKKRKEIVC